MGFRKVCLYLAVIVGCGFFLVHNLSDHSPAPSSQPRPHFIRPIPKPPANNGGVFSDRNVLDNIGPVLGYGALFCAAVYFLWDGIKVFRGTGEWAAFVPIAVLVVIVGGLLSWMGFVDRDMMIIWAIVVSLVVIALLGFQAAAVDREKQRNAAARRQFPDPPKTGGPAKKSDFESWLK